MPRSQIPHFSIRYTSPPAPTFSHSRPSPRLETDLDFGALPEITGAVQVSPRGTDAELTETTNEEDGAPYSRSSEGESDASSKHDSDIEEEEEQEEEQPTPTYGEEETPAFNVSEEGSHTPVEFALLGNRFPEQSIGNLLEPAFRTSNSISERAHNTISEDRTIESEWSQNLLKGVLPHLKRPSSDQQGESDPKKKQPFQRAFLKYMDSLSPDLALSDDETPARANSKSDPRAFLDGHAGGFSFDADAGRIFARFEKTELAMAGKRKSNVNHSSASEHGPSKRINQDSQADGPFVTKSPRTTSSATNSNCLLYTSDAADEMD